MARQLVLLEAGATDWRLDDATRTAGRRGLATARAALAAARATRTVGDPDMPPPAAA